jgi:hypothetical protein
MVFAIQRQWKFCAARDSGMRFGAILPFFLVAEEMRLFLSRRFLSLNGALRSRQTV